VLGFGLLNKGKSALESARHLGLIVGPGLNLQILVSCFVKTPHFEEYLRVKASPAFLKTGPCMHACYDSAKLTVTRRMAPVADQGQHVELFGLFAGDNFAGFAESDQPPQCTPGHSH